MNWTAPSKPAEYAESRLIEAILDGHFPIDSNLPAERELAVQLGITRPTLREALQRLARDGWLEIRQGKPTRVRDYWHEGSLGVLGALAQRPNLLPPNFVSDLLVIRLVLAPAYTYLAAERHPAQISSFLDLALYLPDEPQAFADFDWKLHHTLALRSDNPIFTLILNGFAELYPPMACRYFQTAATRSASLHFYTDLQEAVLSGLPSAAEAVTRRVMHESIELWKQSVSNREMGTPEPALQS
jgi:GntR family transcriptional regulator, negative regulator for fad regulon and positive regulator of fabA